MSYKSDVRFCTNNAGFKRFVDAIRPYYNNLGPFDVIDVDDDGIVFGWDGLKWDENYDEISAIMTTLHDLGSKGYPIEFVRVGESYDDNERIAYDDKCELKRHIDAVTSIIIWH